MMPHNVSSFIIFLALGIGLVWGKFYRKPPYLVIKPWFPVDFPLNQSNDLGIFPFHTLLRTLLMSMAADLPSGQDLSKVRGISGGITILIHGLPMKFFRPTSQKLTAICLILMKNNSTIRVLTYILYIWSYMSVLWTYQIRSYHPQGPIANARVDFGGFQKPISVEAVAFFWHRTLNRTSLCPPVMFVGFKTTL